MFTLFRGRRSQPVAPETDAPELSKCSPHALGTVGGDEDDEDKIRHGLPRPRSPQSLRDDLAVRGGHSGVEAHLAEDPHEAHRGLRLVEQGVRALQAAGKVADARWHEL